MLLDFSKAFDRVPHRLLLKLKHYGVRGNILSWIEDFLSARTQEVIIEGSKSTPSPVSSGVPQGTVLGPLLFLAYINDMPECVRSEIKLFADDSLLYRRIQNNADCCQLQEDLDKLQEWEQKWQMAFNADKCEVIRTTNKKRPLCSDYYIHNQKFALRTEAKECRTFPPSDICPPMKNGIQGHLPPQVIDRGGHLPPDWKKVLDICPLIQVHNMDICPLILNKTQSLTSLSLISN